MAIVANSKTIYPHAWIILSGGPKVANSKTVHPHGADKEDGLQQLAIKPARRLNYTSDIKFM
jgi:hypothetical protein